jgi:hypothetical protein
MDVEAKFDVEVYTNLEVSVEDRDGCYVAVDFCNYEQGTLEITLKEVMPTSEELEILARLKELNINTAAYLMENLDEEYLTQESVLKFVLAQSTEFKFDLVKKLLAKD